MKTQIGIVTEGNFDDNTLTIRTDDDIVIQAGRYAVVPLDEYNELKQANEVKSEPSSELYQNISDLLLITEIESQANYMQMSGAEPNSYTSGAKWAVKELAKRLQ